MMSVLKSWCMRHVPRGVQDVIRLVRGPGVVRRFPADRWEYFDIVRRLVRPGDTVVDAGANIGYITKLLSGLVGPDGHVLSIEPVPVTARVLRRSVKKLRLTNVTVHECALSSREGEAAMGIPEYAAGGENLYESHLLGQGQDAGLSRTVKVRLRRLDDLLDGVAGPVRFLKIDVEGHELDVVKGACSLLAGHAPALLVEVNGDPDLAEGEAQAFFHHMAGLGYDVYVLHAGLLKERKNKDRSVDYLFLRKEHVAQEELAELMMGR